VALAGARRNSISRPSLTAAVSAALHAPVLFARLPRLGGISVTRRVLRHQSYGGTAVVPAARGLRTLRRSRSASISRIAPSMTRLRSAGVSPREHRLKVVAGFNLALHEDESSFGLGSCLCLGRAAEDGRASWPCCVQSGAKPPLELAHKSNARAVLGKFRSVDDHRIVVGVNGSDRSLNVETHDASGSGQSATGSGSPCLTIRRSRDT